MAIQLSEQGFDAISRHFQQVSGIRLSSAKRALVLSRLQKLAADEGCEDVDSFIERVMRGEVSQQVQVRVIDRLTTNETYFFREPAHFADLAQRAKAHVRADDFLVWSAASSSGEEAYSIAMILSEELGKSRWKVWGTDLSTAMVESARRALYPMSRAEGVSVERLKRFALRGEGPYAGQMLIDRALRERVSFRGANLMKPLPGDLPQFDVIFLRNVLIYFDPETKADIVRRVLGLLRPDGALYTGHAESLAGLVLPIKSLAPAIYCHG